VTQVIDFSNWAIVLATATVILANLDDNNGTHAVSLKACGIEGLRETVQAIIIIARLALGYRLIPCCHE